MKSKFDEFYFENDKNYPAHVYWDLYDKNHQEAIMIYEGHIYCPLCHLAPLTVAKGNLRRYFKVIKSDMDKHDANCSYRRKKGTKKDTETFYKDLDKTDIRNRLISCMNRMLKKDTTCSGDKGLPGQTISKNNNSFLDFMAGNKEHKYLPHKNIYSKTLEEDLGIQKIYYGRCALYILKYIPKGEEEIKMYYLKILDINTKKQICDIAIPIYVYKYLENELREIPEEKDKADIYYLCFSGILGKGKYTYKSKLMDSRLLVLERY